MFLTLVATLFLAEASGASSPAAPIAAPQQPAARGSAAVEPASSMLTLAQAEAMAVTRSLALVAAKLELDEAEVAKMAAGLLENPELSYQMQNIVLGDGNAGDAAFPSTFQQIIQTFEVKQVLDVWFKRRAHVRAADAGIAQTRWRVADAVREVRHAAQSAFVTVLREQRESELASLSQARYDETAVLTRKRREAGDVSESELRKVELEQFKYVNNATRARAELAVARAELAAVLAYGNADMLPARLAEPAEDDARGEAAALPELLNMAYDNRPDLRAAAVDEERAALALTAEKRSALPDISLSGGYTHSKFQLSGDNPETLLFSVSLPLPVFNRNQAEIAAAHIEVRRAANAHAGVRIDVQRDVQTAHVQLGRARRMLDTFEGGMLERADRALAVAERSYRAGAVSLLEMLEAQRTYLETRAEYLETLYEWRQAGIDLAYAVGVSL